MKIFDVISDAVIYSQSADGKNEGPGVGCFASFSKRKALKTAAFATMFSFHLFFRSPFLTHKQTNKQTN